VLGEEYLRAIARMSQRERAISRALLDQSDGLIAAIELLGLLTDETAADFDAGHALVAGEASRILREAFLRSYAAHASFVARVNGTVVH
jgi:hypothetical protein